MVTLSQEAIAKIEQFIANAEPMDWFLVISWRKGPADNFRTSQGTVAWERAPDAGWVAELGGWDPGKVPSDAGTPLHGNVRLLIEDRPGAPEPFPGGEVYVEGNEFKVRSHAI
jgi:hypothetical protein